VKANRESGFTIPFTLNLSTRLGYVVTFMPKPLYLRGKSLWYPLTRRLGWAPWLFLILQREKFLALPEIQTPPTLQPIV